MMRFFLPGAVVGYCGCAVVGSFIEPALMGDRLFAVNLVLTAVGVLILNHNLPKKSR